MPVSENELIDQFQRMPPSQFVVKNCSINALKLFYVISYFNPNFKVALLMWAVRKR